MKTVAYSIPGLTWAAITLVNSIDSLGEAVIYLGALLGALEVIRRVVIKPVVALYHKVNRGIDELFELPAWRRRTDHRLEQIEEKVTADVTVKHVHSEPPPSASATYPG